MHKDDVGWMKQALLLAQQAQAHDEVPVGALVVRDQVMLGQGFNCNIGQGDPTAHAEIVALREACKYDSNYRLAGASLYVTLEPCPMCFAAMIQARIATLVFGAADPKGGYQGFFGPMQRERFNHEIIARDGVLAGECAELVRKFFQDKRARGKRKWMRS